MRAPLNDVTPLRGGLGEEAAAGYLAGVYGQRCLGERAVSAPRRMREFGHMTATAAVNVVLLPGFALVAIGRVVRSSRAGVRVSGLAFVSPARDGGGVPC